MNKHSEEYIICPHCNYEHCDRCDYPDFTKYTDGDFLGMACDSCGKLFYVTVQVKWTFISQQQET